MKKSFKFLAIAAAICLSTTACNNSKTGDGDGDSDTTTGVVDSIPEDNSASGDTAVVVDSTQ